MKKINLKLIRSFYPCYDPSKHLAEKWSGTAIDFLDQKQIPFEDRLWVLMRTNFVSEKLMRMFAVWCARQVQHLMTDNRSIAALDFMDAYIENYWLIDDVSWREGWDAARAAAWAAACDSAWAAAWDSARAAACDAAWDSARAAACDAAWAAAWDSAREAQENKLRELILAGIDTGDVK